MREIKQRNESDRIWSECPSCGEAQTVSIRECKCQNQDGTWTYGDLTRPPVISSSTLGQPISANDHSCSLESDENKEPNSNGGFPYRARKIKDCPEQPCCGGWTNWSNWATCESGEKKSVIFTQTIYLNFSDCFLVSRGDPGLQEVTKVRIIKHSLRCDCWTPAACKHQLLNFNLKYSRVSVAVNSQIQRL